MGPDKWRSPDGTWIAQVQKHMDAAEAFQVPKVHCENCGKTLSTVNLSDRRFATADRDRRPLPPEVQTHEQGCMRTTTAESRRRLRSETDNFNREEREHEIYWEKQILECPFVEETDISGNFMCRAKCCNSTAGNFPVINGWRKIPKAPANGYTQKTLVRHLERHREFSATKKLHKRLGNLELGDRKARVATPAEKEDRRTTRDASQPTAQRKPRNYKVVIDGEIFETAPNLSWWVQKRKRKDGTIVDEEKWRVIYYEGEKRHFTQISVKDHGSRLEALKAAKKVRGGLEKKGKLKKKRAGV